MLNKAELKKILETEARSYKWDIDKGEAGKMLELFLEMLDYIVQKNEVEVATPQGPGKGKMT